MRTIRGIHVGCRRPGWMLFTVMARGARSIAAPHGCTYAPKRGTCRSGRTAAAHHPAAGAPDPGRFTTAVQFWLERLRERLADRKVCLPKTRLQRFQVKARPSMANVHARLGPAGDTSYIYVVSDKQGKSTETESRRIASYTSSRVRIPHPQAAPASPWPSHGSVPRLLPYELPIRIPAKNTSTPPRTTWKAAERNGVSINR
jgi:hypothetical protein